MRVDSILKSNSFTGTPNNNWDRKRCNMSFMLLTSAIADCFLVNKLTDMYIRKTSTNKSSLFINGIIGMGILALGGLSGAILNMIDNDKNKTFIGNIAYKIFNGPKAK